MNFVGNVQLVAGNPDVLEGIFNLLEQEGIAPRGNPDVYVREDVAFGVDEARELAVRASSRAVSLERRIFIVITPGMTTEAQNALLKTLEEPPGDALFFFVIPSPETLLPTLRSRAQILDVRKSDFGSTKVRLSQIDAVAFLKASPAERLELLKPLFEKDDEEKRDIRNILLFLGELERLLGADVNKNSEKLKGIYRARAYITDKGSLVKALLEQVALFA